MKKVLVVKPHGFDHYEYPTMDLALEKSAKFNLNQSKMNLFQKISNDEWKVFFTSLEPDFVDVKGSESKKTKTLFFEAVKYDESVSFVNPEIYESYKWVTPESSDR